MRATYPKANKSSEIIICVFSPFGAPLHRTESLPSRTETQNVQDGKGWPPHGCNIWSQYAVPRTKITEERHSVSTSSPPTSAVQRATRAIFICPVTVTQARSRFFCFLLRKTIAHTVHVQRYVQSIFETLHTKANCLSRAPHPGPTANDVNSPFFLTISLGHGARAATRTAGFSQERFY